MSVLDTLLFGYRKIVVGILEAPRRSVLEFVGAVLEDDPVNKRTRVILTGEGAAQATTQVIAGAGLTGGGALSGDVELEVKVDPSRGIGLDGNGLYARTALAKGTKIDGGFVGLALSAPGGAKTLGLDASGLFVARDQSMYGPGYPTIVATTEGLSVLLGGGLLVNGLGIYVNPAQFAALVGGKTTAAQARGKTLLFDDMFSASGNVSITTGTQTSIATLSLGTLSVGDTIDAFGMATRDGAQGDTMQFQITSSPTLGLGTVYSTHTAYVAGAGVGGSGGIPVVYRSSVAGPHYAHLSMAKTGAANFACFQRRITGKVYAP